MSIRNQLAGGGAGVSIIDDVIISTSGNWTKAAGVLPTDKVKVLITGAGAGGGKQNAPTVSTYGGTAGSFAELEFFAYELASSVAAVIGAGGAGSAVNNVSGANGGNTSFNGVTVPGGVNSSANSQTAPPAIDLSVGSQGLTSLHLVTFSGVQVGSLLLNPNVMKVEPAFLLTGTSLSGRRMRAGGYGAPFDNSTAMPAGVSFNGGNGGAATVGASGSPGVAPGGGGGAGASTGTKGGDGARGEVRVIVMRGKS